MRNRPPPNAPTHLQLHGGLVMGSLSGIDLLLSCSGAAHKKKKLQRVA